MIVYCLGMQSSGSTWLYNVVREIMTAAGLEHAAFRVEMYENFLDGRAAEYRNGVLRGHNIQSGLLRMLNMADIKAVLSFRDPRDAVASFLQRFGDYGAKFLPVCTQTARNLATLLSASQELDQMSFFYEDGFTENPQTVRDVAEFLGLPLADHQAQAIFEKYRAATVQAFIANIDQLPDERRFVDQVNNTMDRVTSFHRTHISDMRVDKWRDVLSEEQQSAVSELFDDYARLLRERTTGIGRTPRRDGVRRLLPVSVTFSSRLFAPVDSLDNFTRFLTCAEVRSPRGIQVLRAIYLPEGEWDIRLRVPGLTGAAVKLCQNGKIVHQAAMSDGTSSFEYINRLHDHVLDLNIVYDGMDDDIAADRPPPAAVLEATLRRALDEI